MKFAHIADVHLGNWRDDKLKELVVSAFEETIDKIIGEKVDFLLIAGDLFHTALPGIDHVKVVVKKLNEVKRNGIPIYYIAGSHDYSPSGKTMLDVLEEAEIGVNVTKGEVVDGKLKLKFTVDEGTGAKITGLIGKRGMLEKDYYEALDRGGLEGEDGFKIFLFHTALDELKPSELGDMPSSPISFLPRGFDYYAGGHVHIVKKASLEGYKNIVYPGPVFPANYHELEQLRGGGFYIYDDGELEWKDVIVKDVFSNVYNVDGLSGSEAERKVEKVCEEGVDGKLVLLRVQGKLEEGTPQDIDFKGIISKLYEKGAYFVLKNTTKLSSKEFEEVKVETASVEELEYKLIKEHLTGKNIFKDEYEATKQLLKLLSSEKHEGETQSDYEERMKKDVNTLVNSFKE